MYLRSRLPWLDEIFWWVFVYKPAWMLFSPRAVLQLLGKKGHLLQFFEVTIPKHSLSNLITFVTRSRLPYRRSQMRQLCWWVTLNDSVVFGMRSTKIRRPHLTSNGGFLQPTYAPSDSPTARPTKNPTKVSCETWIMIGLKRSSLNSRLFCYMKPPTSAPITDSPTLLVSQIKLMGLCFPRILYTLSISIGIFLVADVCSKWQSYSSTHQEAN